MTARLRALGIAVVLAIAMLAGARQLSHGYSVHSAYRAQVDAFLSGRLALTPYPDGLAHDLAWTASGVQQVWGLGVPLWQTPFELAGRAVGFTPFPDRVAMVAFLALALFVLLRAFPGWRGAGAILVTGLLPAIIAMMRGRMECYEDAALYAYMAAMILLGSTVIFARAPTPGRYLWLLAGAGATGLIRPTAWFYGLAAASIATVIWWRAGGRRSVIAGVALFVLGGFALYATNVQRFGSGGEFGHRLNLESLSGNIVATRFSYPFERVGVVAATEELVGSLFDRPDARSAKKGFYQKDLHLGQADVPRFREYYFTTFSWPYVPLLAAGIVLAVLGFRRRDGTAMALAVFAALGSAPLWWFYLRSPSLTSRYQLDLAPAFAALLVIGWRELVARVDLRIASAIVTALWALAIVTSSTYRPKRGSDPVDRSTATRAYDTSRPLHWTHTLPDAYDADDPLAPVWNGVLWQFERCVDVSGVLIPCAAPGLPGDVHYRGLAEDRQWEVWRYEVGDDVDLPDELLLPQETLYLNGFGWRLDGDASVPVATHFFVEDPRFLEVETYGDDPAKIRAVIGATHLAPVAYASTRRGTRVRFESPEPLPAGLQVAFVAFGDDDTLDGERTSYLLRSVRWR